MSSRHILQLDVLQRFPFSLSSKPLFGGISVVVVVVVLKQGSKGATLRGVVDVKLGGSGAVRRTVAVREEQPGSAFFSGALPKSSSHFVQSGAGNS